MTDYSQVTAVEHMRYLTVAKIKESLSYLESHPEKLGPFTLPILMSVERDIDRVGEDLSILVKLLDTGDARG